MGEATSHPCQVSGLIKLVLTILARKPSKPYEPVNTSRIGFRLQQRGLAGQSRNSPLIKRSGQLKRESYEVGGGRWEFPSHQPFMIMTIRYCNPPS